MKARPFLAVVLAVALLLLSLGMGGWWLTLRRSPLRLQQHSLQLPLAARFVPRNAPLSLHLLVPPDRLAAYARAVAPPRQRREAAAALDRLRDGAFASAGLDYSDELAGWLGAETSLAVLAPEGSGGPTGWLLALRSRDPEGARRFLQRFWQTRSLAGTALQISSYRGMGLISGRGALAGQSSRPLATALIDDQLVLIASGRGVLEQALDVSQIDELNQAGNLALGAALERLPTGVALLTARPEAFEDWLGLPDSVIAAAGVGELMAALSPQGAALDLEALLALRQPLPPLRLDPGLDLTSSLRGPVVSLALVQNPASLLATEDSDPDSGVDPDHWRTLLGPLLEEALMRLGGPLPPLVAAGDQGPLLWSQRPEGWLLATAADQPSPDRIQPRLADQGFIVAPLRRSGRSLQVWTRLEPRSAKGDPDRLQATVAGARLQQVDRAWWAEGLAALDDQLEDRAPPRQRLAQLEALAHPLAPLQWAMAPDPARRVLSQWQPWRLLTSLAGSPLGSRVRGLALSLEADSLPPAMVVGSGATPADTPVLALHARLELG